MFIFFRRKYIYLLLFKHTFVYKNFNTFQQLNYLYIDIKIILPNFIAISEVYIWNISRKLISSSSSIYYVYILRAFRVVVLCSHVHFLTLHVPASPYHVVQSNLVLPSQPDSFEPIPLGRCQFLSGTNSNAHTSYPLQNQSS